MPRSKAYDERCEIEALRRRSPPQRGAANGAPVAARWRRRSAPSGCASRASSSHHVAADHGGARSGNWLPRLSRTRATRPICERQEAEVAQLRANDASADTPISTFAAIPGLSNEMVEKLSGQPVRRRWVRRAYPRHHAGGAIGDPAPCPASRSMTEDEAKAWIRERFGVSTCERSWIASRRSCADEAAKQNLIAASTLDYDLVAAHRRLGPADRPRSQRRDQGTGSISAAVPGFPGLVVAALTEATPGILVEPRTRRASSSCVRGGTLGLPTGLRRGQQGRKPSNESVAVISARAVAELGHNCSHPQPLHRFVHTLWVLPKGRNGAIEEVEAVRRAKWQGVFHVEPSITQPDSGIVIAARGAADDLLLRSPTRRAGWARPRLRSIWAPRSRRPAGARIDHRSRSAGQCLDRARHQAAPSANVRATTLLRGDATLAEVAIPTKRAAARYRHRDGRPVGRRDRADRV
jgi:16S rRNA (guanine527-N7)-methyltransferase